MSYGPLACCHLQSSAGQTQAWGSVCEVVAAGSKWTKRTGQDSLLNESQENARWDLEQQGMMGRCEFHRVASRSQRHLSHMLIMRFSRSKVTWKHFPHPILSPLDMFLLPSSGFFFTLAHGDFYIFLIRFARRLCKNVLPSVTSTWWRWEGVWLVCAPTLPLANCIFQNGRQVSPPNPHTLLQCGVDAAATERCGLCTCP